MFSENKHALRVAAASCGFSFQNMTFQNFESVFFATNDIVRLKMTTTDNFFECYSCEIREVHDLESAPGVVRT